jgi:hypothetical protein
MEEEEEEVHQEQGEVEVGGDGDDKGGLKGGAAVFLVADEEDEFDVPSPGTGANVCIQTLVVTACFPPCLVALDASVGCVPACLVALDASVGCVPTTLPCSPGRKRRTQNVVMCCGQVPDTSKGKSPASPSPTAGTFRNVKRRVTLEASENRVCSFNSYNRCH